MKNSFLVNRILIFLGLFFLITISCSKEDTEQETKTPEPQEEDLPEEITLTTDISGTDVMVGETIEFEVTGSDGKNYSSEASVYLKGKKIPGNSFNFINTGNHYFYAEYKSLKSNVVTIKAHDNENIETPQSLTLTANREPGEIDINEEIIFTLTGDNGLEYTSLSTITSNGEPISGNEFRFSEGGEYSFEASYESVTSNSLEFTVRTENYIAINEDKILKSEEISFEYFGTGGESKTNEATFYVNGNAVAGNTFSSTNTGTYEVYAKSPGGEQTSIKTFEVFIPSKKVLFEDYTGTWCGWCPRVTNAILELKEQTDDLVVIALHVDDEMEKNEVFSLMELFQIEAFPHARYDRTELLEYPEDDPANFASILDLAGNESPYTIAINTSLEGDQLEVEVRLKAEVAIPQGYKMVAYVLQDGLVFPQDNYLNDDASSRWYQLGDPISNFVHDDVFEATLTPILGSELEEMSALEIASFNYGPIDLSQFTYFGNYYNPNRFEVVAFLTDENNTVLNAQKVTAGRDVDFE